MGKKGSKEEPDSEGKEGKLWVCCPCIISFKTRGERLDFLNLIIHDFEFFEWLQNL